MRDALLDLEERRQPKSVRRNLDALGQSWAHPNLFSQVVSVPTRAIAGMVRGSDPETSQLAAIRVLPKLSKVEALVLAAILTKPMTAREAEGLACFTGVCAPNTVRTRISALARKGLIEPAGNDGRMTIWRVVG